MDGTKHNPANFNILHFYHFKIIGILYVAFHENLNRPLVWERNKDEVERMLILNAAAISFLNSLIPFCKKKKE